MAQQIPPEQLKRVLKETLSPHSETRRNAERQLNEAQKIPGHSLQVLQLVANANAAEADVRQAAAIHFKNVVKNGWNTEEETQGVVISQEERATIKSHLVHLMCTVPPQIQAQISEAISLIADVDFPQRWDNLLTELVQQFGSSDPAVVNGVLKTANSIFKRFRYVGRSDELYNIIAYSLERIQAPLLTLFVETGKAIDAYHNDPNQLVPRLESLRLMCRIFFSLNYQDLPEFFEDHMKEWMEQFAKYLQYSNPCVEDDSDTDPSPIDKLQAAIVQNLALYADKDEEPFLPFLPEFTKLVWNLLMKVTAEPKHDQLATTSIKFLSSLVSKLMHKNLFQDEATLREIVLKIVIPNLTFRESDEELFEDNPGEYILTEVEGSDSESRRRCSHDLLRAMCRQFEQQTTAICSEHVGVMLEDYRKDPSKWAAKDAAINLMLGISIRKESTLGVSETNEAVNVMDFFNNHIFPELQDPNHNSRPVVKATSLKFVTTFRNQFTREQLVALMPTLITHLGSPIIVVHTFAAYAIERILLTKEDIHGVSKQSKITGAELKPFLEQLFTGLFSIIENQDLNENEYVMKCVMRALSVAQEDVIPIAHIIIEKLTNTLARVAKNPRNPQYNHFLFESIAVLVKSVCSKDPSQAPNLESLLFPPFQTILQMEILEFTPYVFQILAQMLEYRSVANGLGQYEALFRPLLTPTLWERKGNVPALTRLVTAYLLKAGPELVAAGHLTGLLGCFQKLLSSAATEGDAFKLLNSFILYVPDESLRPHIRMVFTLLLTRLQNAKSSSHRYNRFSSHMIYFFALFTAKKGPRAFFDELESIQRGMTFQLIVQVWLPRLREDAPKGLETKIQVVGLTRLITETPSLLDDTSGQQIWCGVIVTLVSLLTSPMKSDADADLQDLLVAGDMQYDSTFSSLTFAKKQATDPFPDITDPVGTFAKSLGDFSRQFPGRVPPLIHEALKDDPKLSAGLESMFQKNGVNLS